MAFILSLLSPAGTETVPPSLRSSNAQAANPQRAHVRKVVSAVKRCREALSAWAASPVTAHDREVREQRWWDRRRDGALRRVRDTALGLLGVGELADWPPRNGFKEHLRALRTGMGASITKQSRERAEMSESQRAYYSCLARLADEIDQLLATLGWE